MMPHLPVLAVDIQMNKINIHEERGISQEFVCGLS